MQNNLEENTLHIISNQKNVSSELDAPTPDQPLYKVGTKLLFLDEDYYPAGTTGKIVKVLKNGGWCKKHAYKVLLSNHQNIIISQDNIIDNNFGIMVDGSYKNPANIANSWLNCF